MMGCQDAKMRFLSTRLHPQRLPPYHARRSILVISRSLSLLDFSGHQCILIRLRDAAKLDKVGRVLYQRRSTR